MSVVPAKIFAMNTGKEIGERVRYWRGVRGLSANALAKAVGSRHQYIRYLEEGTIASPGVDLLGKIATVLDVPFSELIGDTGPVNSEELTEADLMHQLARGSDVDAHELARWFEVYRQLDPEAREKWLAVMKLNAGRTQRGEDTGQAQQG